MTTWRERIAAMKAEERRPNEYERELLSTFETCLVGEQSERGVLPPNWLHDCWRAQVTPGFDWPYLALYELGLEATEIYDPVKLDHQLDRIEDEAMKIKRELSA